jgi:hypothetical protein
MPRTKVVPSRLTRSLNPPHCLRVTDTTARGLRAFAVRGSLGLVGRWTPITIWFCGVVVLMAALAISHLFSLPRLARRDSRLAAGLAELLPNDRDGWASIHVLYTECRCSQRIFEHLRTSERPQDLHEIVLLVGEDHDAIATRLGQRGFEVVSIAPEKLDARFGIEGAPAFVLVDPARNVRYSGGYTTRQQGPNISDLAIVREIRQGDEVADLPVFGCAISQRLKAVFDPFATRR